MYVAGIMHANPYYNYEPVYWENTGSGMNVQTPTNDDSWANAITVSGSDIYLAGYVGQTAAYWKNGTLNSLADLFYITSIANGIQVSNSEVYVVGAINLSGLQAYSGSTAVYWKNGVVTKLTNDVGSVANAIVISGNDIYIAGAIYDNADDLPRAAYWKNGALVKLNSKYSIANSITIHGNDVYVAGNVGEYNATYWKNGIAVTLGNPNMPEFEGNAYGIAVRD